MWSSLLFFRTERADSALHQTADGQDADAEAGLLAHSGAGEAEAKGDPGQTKGMLCTYHLHFHKYY